MCPLAPVLCWRGLEGPPIALHSALRPGAVLAPRLMKFSLLFGDRSREQRVSRHSAVRPRYRTVYHNGRMACRTVISAGWPKSCSASLVASRHLDRLSDTSLAGLSHPRMAHQYGTTSAAVFKLGYAKASVGYSETSYGVCGTEEKLLKTCICVHVTALRIVCASFHCSGQWLQCGTDPNTAIFLLLSSSP
jgi:hypothetical protein